MIKNVDSGLILDKMYSVMLHDGWKHRYCDPFLVLGSAHFDGTLIIHTQGKLVFNLQNGEGSVIIPFENIKWMVPIKEKEREEEYNWE